MKHKFKNLLLMVFLSVSAVNYEFSHAGSFKKYENKMDCLNDFDLNPSDVRKKISPQYRIAHHLELHNILILCRDFLSEN